MLAFTPRQTDANIEDQWKRDSSCAMRDSTSHTPREIAEDLEEKISDTNTYRLSYLQSSLFATILEDAITELRILENSNSELRVLKTLDDIELLRALKYNVKQPTLTDELDGVNSANISSNSFKLQKLYNDRTLVADSLIAIYLELSINQCWTVLPEKIQERIRIYEHRANVAEEATKNRITRRELARQLRQQRNHAKSVSYDREVTIQHLRTKVEDNTLDAEARKRYIDSWERARREQHAHTIKDVETPPSQVIEAYKQRVDQEQRSHAEIEMLINISINETLREVESWMNKYDRDMEAIDLKIQIRKNEYDETVDRREELEETIEKHEQLIKVWVHFKEEREKARVYREQMNKSACIVQAWWRGLLVRLQMGPYKVTKKAGISAAKKKKK